MSTSGQGHKRKGKYQEGASTQDSHRKRRPKRYETNSPDTLPGVQKLKSALRQTRRLLAKDISPDVRVETERRLKSLEEDLARSGSARKERSLAIRYHKVKFFERQKVIRKLNQTAKRLSMGDNDPELENSLFELRVDLNYILHYPKTKRYISLFPPEVRNANGVTAPPPSDPNREEVREWVREQMRNGGIPMEPERHLDSIERTTAGNRGQLTRPVKSGDHKSGLEKVKVDVMKGTQVESDAFFGEDDDDDDDSDDGSDEDE